MEVPEEWNSAGKGSKGEIDRPQDQREHEEGAWFMGLMAFRCTQQPARRIVLGEFESLGVSSHQSRFEVTNLSCDPESRRNVRGLFVLLCSYVTNV